MKKETNKQKSQKTKTNNSLALIQTRFFILKLGYFLPLVQWEPFAPRSSATGLKGHIWVTGILFPLLNWVENILYPRAWEFSPLVDGNTSPFLFPSRAAVRLPSVHWIRLSIFPLWVTYYPIIL